MKNKLCEIKFVSEFRKCKENDEKKNKFGKSKHYFFCIEVNLGWLTNVTIFSTMYYNFLLCFFIEEENKENCDAQEGVTTRRAKKAWRELSNH